MSHPNLSDGINRNIIKSEIEGGIWLTMPDPSASVAHAEAKEKGNVLGEGKTLLVQTKNTLYRIEKQQDGFYMSGHPRICPEPVKVNIHGSTWGGSMLKMGWVGRGMNMEFSVPSDGRNFRGYTTTEIQEIKEL